MKNKLITGIPRSGTSLLTSLIAEHYESVVFSEPQWLKEVRMQSQDCTSFSQNLKIFIDSIRENIKRGKPVKLKINPETNLLASNYFRRDGKANIKTQKEEYPIILPQSLFNKSFFIKANTQFTACLCELCHILDVKLICVIRNPVACIMSWRSLNIPVSYGNMKIAEKYSSEYLPFVAGAKDLLHKQVLIIDWFFKKYHENTDCVEVIKYESLIEDTNTVIQKIIGSRPNIKKTFVSMNKSKYYNIDERNRITEYLLKYGVYFKEFYSTEKLTY